MNKMNCINAELSTFNYLYEFTDLKEEYNLNNFEGRVCLKYFFSL